MKDRISEIAGRLNAECWRLSTRLMGHPNPRQSNKLEWRWGEHGRFRLHIAGPKHGRWSDFAAGDHGDMLDLIGRELGLDNRGSIDWALDWLDLDDGDIPARPGNAANGAGSAGTVDQLRSSEVAEKRSDRALHTWQETIPLPGTIAERYLQIRCGSVPEDILGTDVLRFHPRCVFKLADNTMVRLPALIGLFHDMQTGDPVAIHRTALLSDGSGKDEQTPGLGNSKKMLGPSAGAAIMLSPFEEITLGLGICEGIETGISIAQSDWRPLWVVGSVGGIARFPPLGGLDCLTIFADHDENAACQTAAIECWERLSQHNIEVDAIMPRTEGNDWNDTIQAMKDAA